VSRKPDFFIVGAPKSGTSSLYRYLAQHPDVFLSEPKEPHFFHNRRLPGAPVLGEKNLDEYLHLFRGVPKETKAGDASTSYLYSTNAALEIGRFKPEAKILMVLRNPVDRAYSHYWNHVRDGIESLSFEEALRVEPRRVSSRRWCGFYYVEVGRYAEQVARYLEVFGEDSVRIYLFEDLQKDAEGVCQDVFRFLEVDTGRSVDTSEIYNRSGPPRSTHLASLLYYLSRKRSVARALPTAFGRGAKEWLLARNTKPVPEMDADMRSWLQEVFRDDILRLEELLGRDLNHWLR
jgi:hypothetical protein